MFRNTLFLKIILVFTLPALGMMYFSTVLVYDKIKSLSEIKHIDNNIQYMTRTQELVHSLQKERGYTVTYIASNKFKTELTNQRVLTDKLYNNFVEQFKMVQNEDRLAIDIKKIQNLFLNLRFIRSNVDESNLNSDIALTQYNRINTFLLTTLEYLKHIEYAATFNIKFDYILNLLIAKEYSGIERAIVALSLSEKNFNTERYKSLIENYTIQDINLKKYIAKATKEEVNYFKEQLTLKEIHHINDIREKIINHKMNIKVSVEKWWEISTTRIDAFKDIYNYSKTDMQNHSIKIRHNATINQLLSLCFLFISFATLISLLFVLRNIIFNEQKSYNKINKQQEVYKLLNAVNVFLLTIDNQRDLYKEICKLISLTQSMSFGFIYKVSKKNTRLIAQEGELKNIVAIKLQEKENRDNLITKAINQNENIIVESFEKQNLSILTDVAKEYKLESAASFPIKRFDETVAVLVLYSNEVDFFDNEVEILFNTMIHDMSHSLEKMAYQKVRMEQEQELKIASYAFESNEPMIITNQSALIMKANQAFCDKMGYSKDEVIGKNPSMFRSKHHQKEFYTQMWCDISTHGSWSGEIYNVMKNKEVVPLRSAITAIKDAKGNTTHYLAQYIDISEQIDKQNMLVHQATHDNLTGLPNRLLLLDRIERALTKIERHNNVGGLIFIDLDNFKEVNDTLGHEIGDKLLIMVAQKINETIRKEDTIARIGGDEFIVLADNIADNEEAAKENMSYLAQKLKLSLNSILEIDGHKNISTPSIGVTLFSDATADISDIIKEADSAMYKAKKQGKNCIAFFED